MCACACARGDGEPVITGGTGNLREGREGRTPKLTSGLLEQRPPLIPLATVDKLGPWVSIELRAVSSLPGQQKTYLSHKPQTPIMLMTPEWLRHHPASASGVCAGPGHLGLCLTPPPMPCTPRRSTPPDSLHPQTPLTPQMPCAPQFLGCVTPVSHVHFPSRRFSAHSCPLTLWGVRSLSPQRCAQGNEGPQQPHLQAFVQSCPVLGAGPQRGGGRPTGLHTCFPQRTGPCWDG